MGFAWVLVLDPNWGIIRLFCEMVIVLGPFSSPIVLRSESAQNQWVWVLKTLGFVKVLRREHLDVGFGV